MEEELTNKGLLKVLKLYNDLELKLLEEIASHFSINEEFINSDIWRIQKLNEMGVFNKDIEKYIKEYTNASPNAIKNAFKGMGEEIYNIDKLNSAFKEGKVNIDPNILLTNGVIDTLIATQYNELNNSLIQLSNKIENATKQAYLNVVENTYLKTATGTHSYGEAIKESIIELGNKGIRTLTYSTIDETTGEVLGVRTYDVAGAVSRDILTNTRNLYNNINMKIVNELEPKYIKLSEHLNCRPTHFDWQGTIIKREDLIPITGYGEVDGLGGINCRHYFEPYFGEERGDAEKKYTQKECEDIYTKTQEKRYLERGIRSWKRKKEMFKENGDIEEYKKASAKLTQWNKRYRLFCDKYNMQIDYIRTYAK